MSLSYYNYFNIQLIYFLLAENRIFLPISLAKLCGSRLVVWYVHGVGMLLFLKVFSVSLFCSLYKEFES